MNAAIVYPSDSMNKQLAPSIIPTAHRKSSVSFVLPPNYQQDEEEAQELLSPRTTSPAIDINAQPVPDTMLVALVDRSREMKDLEHRNKPFFLTLAYHLDTKWEKFENTLYCERGVMSDSEWLEHITIALQNAPSLLEQFKDLVGFMPEQAPDDEDDDQEFSRVDLTRIRSKIDTGIISPVNYPQFYINCQETMQNKQDYTSFIITLNDSELSDQVWLSQMQQALRNHSDLLKQFQEIVAYETEQDV